QQVEAKPAPAPVEPAVVPVAPSTQRHNGGPPAPEAYSELLSTIDDLRRLLGDYRARMDQVLRLVSEQERRRKKGV
ncbi:MAG: hypothetical protein ACE5ED_11960, partial [Rhodothalassiaceae bacterium]